jgi:hypothetical protein
MTLEGGCFCGAIRYVTEGEPVIKGACHCRQCQYFAGGGPNIFLAMPIVGFKYTKGTPKSYTRADPPLFEAKRDFCGECGVHLVTHAAPMPQLVFVKVGTLDDPADFGGPDVAIFTCDQQTFHQIAPGVAQFERMPPG